MEPDTWGEGSHTRRLVPDNGCAVPVIKALADAFDDGTLTIDPQLELLRGWPACIARPAN